MQCKFENIHGYSTYELAERRGEAVERARNGINYRWAVIALPNGRFAPMVILNSGIPGGPGMFLGERNVCMAN